VQCFDMLGDEMDEVYAVCSDSGKPLIMHVGREPKSEAYACDPYALCRVEGVKQVLDRWPDLHLCVPHLGADEFDAYRRLIETRDTLWLDTSVSLADYVPLGTPSPLESYRSDRIMFGTDFPNLPYAWDREIRRVAAMGLSPQRLERFLWRNAAEFYGMPDLDRNDR
jgi:predicted TIM-barrel fold metal-dependent hydrolase